MRSVPGYEDFIKIEPVQKGWSGDDKFFIETAGGERLLLRLADISKFESKTVEFDMMRHVTEHGVAAPKPVAFGICSDGKKLYSLITWIDGEELGTVLPGMSKAEQYEIGQKVGELQRSLHSVPVELDNESWADWYGQRVQEKLDRYFENRLDLHELKPCVDYLIQQKYLLDNRPQTFHHGDLNPTNIIVKSDGSLAIIDFNACERNACDPVWEFCTIPYGDNPNPYYYSGLIDGYYGGNPPHTEFAVLAYYFAWEALHGIVDSRIPPFFMAKEGKRHLKNVLSWFDNMQNTTPTWYLEMK